MTKQEAVAAICEHIHQNSLDVEYNPSNFKNGTIGIRTYEFYSENVRAREEGHRRKIDLHVYLTKQADPAGQELKQMLTAKRDRYEAAARELGAVFQWNEAPQGGGSCYLVQFVFDFDWQNWNGLTDDDKGRIVRADAFLREILAESGGDPGHFTNRRGERARGMAEALQHNAADGVAQEGENQMEGDLMKRNLIIFGAPGTGKSHSLRLAYEGAEAPFADRYERVTFYPTYSYSQFVGTYKPVMKVVGGEERISYQFVPGPFLRSLVKAANDPDHNYLLIVEEINRANAAAVFGDVFQILDRGDDGESEYSIGVSEDVIRYLQGTVGLGEPVLSPAAKRFFGMATADDEPTGDCALKLPKNFYIWATMNSADQGVFPLDTAFKRRWEFEYLRLDAGENADDCAAWVLAGRRGYHWNEVRKLINSVLSAQGVNEDKLMGPFFVKAARDNEGNHLPISQQAFESKVLMYLWEDAARMCRRQIFGDVKTYSQLLNKWEDDGLAIFTPALERDERLRRDYGNLVYPPAQNPEPNAQ